MHDDFGDFWADLMSAHGGGNVDHLPNTSRITWYVQVLLRKLQRAQERLRQYGPLKHAGWGGKGRAWQVGVRMSPHIYFERQLDPDIPPPDKVRPHFCYSDTLIFYKRGTCEKVWEEQIAECRLKFEDRRSITLMEVQWDKEWGWKLIFEVSHDEARRIWELAGYGVLPKPGEDRTEKRAEKSPEIEPFSVTCDRSNNSEDDIRAGRLNTTITINPELWPGLPFRAVEE